MTAARGVAISTFHPPISNEVSSQGALEAWRGASIARRRLKERFESLMVSCFLARQKRCLMSSLLEWRLCASMSAKCKALRGSIAKRRAMCGWRGLAEERVRGRGAVTAIKWGSDEEKIRGCIATWAMHVRDWRARRHRERVAARWLYKRRVTDTLSR